MVRSNEQLRTISNRHTHTHFADHNNFACFGTSVCRKYVCITSEKCLSDVRWMCEGWRKRSERGQWTWKRVNNLRCNLKAWGCIVSTNRCMFADELFAHSYAQRMGIILTMAIPNRYKHNNNENNSSNTKKEISARMWQRHKQPSAQSPHTARVQAEKWNRVFSWPNIVTIVCVFVYGWCCLSIDLCVFIRNRKYYLHALTEVIDNGQRKYINYVRTWWGAGPALRDQNFPCSFLYSGDNSSCSLNILYIVKIVRSVNFIPLPKIIPFGFCGRL